MSLDDKSRDGEEGTPDFQPDPALARGIKSRLRDGQLPCAVAFQIAADLGVSPGDVGRAADALRISLAKCQLGLFGYQPEKKIVRAETDAPEDLVGALRAALENDRLPCAALWQIAERFKLPKMKVSAVCEGGGIKIKPCQLGAF